MTEEQRIEEAMKHLKDTVFKEDHDSAFKQALKNLRAEIKGIPPTGITISTHGTF